MKVVSLKEFERIFPDINHENEIEDFFVITTKTKTIEISASFISSDDLKNLK